MTLAVKEANKIHKDDCSVFVCVVSVTGIDVDRWQSPGGLPIFIHSLFYTCCVALPVTTSNVVLMYRLF